MWEKPYISIFVEIGALRNFTHFGGHLKNGCQNDRHFEIALVTIKGDYSCKTYNYRIKSQKCANDISQSIANKTWEFHSLLLLTPVLILTVKSTTDTSGTGTLKAIPVSLL